MAGRVSVLGAAGFGFETTGRGAGATDPWGLLEPMDPMELGRGWLAGMDRVVVPPSPRKSPTRVSTNWLIEMLLVSQNDFNFS